MGVGRAGIKVERLKSPPRELMDALLNVHAAVDLESGHFTCHYNDISLLAVSDGEAVVPGIGINCLVIVSGRSFVDRLLAGSVEVEGRIDFEESGMIVGGYRASRSLVKLITAASEEGYRISFRGLSVEGLGNVVAVLLEDVRGEKYLAIPYHCEEGDHDGFEGESLHI